MKGFRSLIQGEEAREATPARSRVEGIPGAFVHAPTASGIPAQPLFEELVGNGHEVPLGHEPHQAILLHHRKT